MSVKVSEDGTPKVDDESSVGELFTEAWANRNSKPPRY